MNGNPQYRPDIDGLRAVAIIAVVLFHAGLGCSGGFVGVDIFFVISGYLITSHILKEMPEGAFSLMAFWERRIRRILPALAAMMLVTFAIGWCLFLPVDFRPLGKSMVAQAILLSNVYFYRESLVEDGYFGPVSDSKPLLHTWSLAVEEQFYLLFPLLLVFLARRRRFSLPGVLFWLGIASLVLSVAGSYYQPVATFYLLPTRAWELLVGALLAALPRRSNLNPPTRAAAGWLGLALVIYPIFLYTRATRFPGLAALPPCLGAGLIIFSGGPGRGKTPLVNRGLAQKPVVFIGLVSYSLYLWHWPLLVFSKYYNYCHYGTRTPTGPWRAALVAASVVLAVASWKWIETPFRRPGRGARRAPVFALAGGSLLTLALLGGVVCWQNGFPARITSRAGIFLNAKYDVAFRNDITPAQAAAGQFAELGGQGAGKPVTLVLWGDSHAMHLAPVLDDLCRQFSVRGVQATHSSTAPMLDYVFHSTYGLHDQAPAFSQAVVDFILKNHVKIVVLAAVWPSYGPPGVASARLVATVQTLLAAGAVVYLVKDVPRPRYDVPLRASLTVRQQGDLAQLQIHPAQYAALNDVCQPMFDSLAKMGVIILDAPRYFLNTHGLYDVIRNDRVLYSDEGHLTVTGSKLLRPMFEPLFQSVNRSALSAASQTGISAVDSVHLKAARPDSPHVPAP